MQVRGIAECGMGIADSRMFIADCGLRNAGLNLNYGLSNINFFPFQFSVPPIKLFDEIAEYLHKRT